MKRWWNKLFNLFYIDIMGSLFELYFYLVLRGKISGVENIPQGPCVFVFNHVSYLDFCICYPLFKHRLKKKLHFLAKHKLYESPFWKKFLVHSNSIIIDYTNLKSVKNVFVQMKDRLANGEMVAIFPEGTRSDDGRIKPAAEGVGSLVMEANVPIVPVGLNGFYQAWPRHKKLPGIARCHIKIGKPIVIHNENFTNRKLAKGAISHLVMHKIAQLVNTEYLHTPEKIELLLKTMLLEEIAA